MTRLTPAATSSNSMIFIEISVFAVPSALWWGVGVVELQLQEGQIQPFAKLGTHFAHATYHFEAQINVQLHRRVVAGLNARHHHVFADRPRLLNQRNQQRFTYPAAAA